MFPVSDVIPSRTRPVVSLTLIVLIAAVFLYELRLDDYGLQALFDRFGVIPGALQPRSLAASLFLHAGWVHVGSNMLYIWLFGPNVESAFGRGPFLLFYLCCGTLASSVHIVVHPDSVLPLVGASGAVAGVMGAYLALYPQSRVLTVLFAVVYVDVVEIPAMIFLGLWFVIQLAAEIGSLGAHAAVGPAAFWSHVTGFAVGILCGLYARYRTSPLRRYWH